MIEEALKNLNDSEQKLHEVLKDTPTNDIVTYGYKRMLYNDPTDEDITLINQIYEQGTCFIDFDFFDKKHTMKLLTSEDKDQINVFLKQFIPAESSGFDSIELENKRAIATVALSLTHIDGKSMTELLLDFNGEDVIENRFKFINKLNSALIKSLHDKYLDTEARILMLFQFESVRKK